MSVSAETDLFEDLDPHPIVAVGDIHGRADLLDKLIDRVERRLMGRQFRWVFLGDYIDRGADSRGVLSRLVSLQKRYPDTVFLKGNHEEAIIDFLGAPEESMSWLDWGGAETLKSYGIEAKLGDDPKALAEAFAERLPEEHFAFLMSLTLWHREQRYLFVHAGLDPDRALEDQRERDLLWIRERFLQGGEGRFGDSIIVHGHTPVKKVEDLPWRINLDTGACWSAKLTAAVLEGDNRRFITT